MIPSTQRPTEALVDLDAVAANAQLLLKLADGAELCAVVKADGYGHGAVAAARAALSGGASRLAVATVDEGAVLRGNGVTAPIIVFGEPFESELATIVDLGLDGVVARAGAIDALAARAEGGNPVRVHLCVDTGMHRAGCDPADAVDLARRITERPSLRLAGTWTHFPRADEADEDFTELQVDRFLRVVAAIGDAGIDPGIRHAANSAGAMAHPSSRLDMVRCGIALYGISPSKHLAGRHPLRPALTLRTAVVSVRLVPAGDGVSYGHRWRAPTDTWVATLPIGYADGVTRRLGLAGGEVLIGGHRRPIAGVVTMDQTMVSCGSDPPQIGDEVVLIGSQDGTSVTAEEWADRLDTIGYEVVCGISSRVPRRHVGTIADQP
ncbi:MAG TPA: alanine racemase [Acidimicrobiales bacterium]